MLPFVAMQDQDNSGPVYPEITLMLLSVGKKQVLATPTKKDHKFSR